MVILKKSDIISYDRICHNKRWSGLRRKSCLVLDEYLSSNKNHLLKVYITGGKSANIAFESKALPVLLEGDDGSLLEDNIYYLLFSDERLTKISRRFLLDDSGNRYKMIPVARCPYNYYSYPILKLEKY